MEITLQIIKLSNGDTIVSDVVEEQNKTILLLNPLEIRTEQHGRKTASMVAVQWFPFSENDNYMTIQKNHIVGMTPASNEICEYYVHAVDSIIANNRSSEEQKPEDTTLEELEDYIFGANTSSTMLH